MPKKHILAYSIYYYPEVASTAQLYTELFESLSTEFDITVICAVPCYTGKISSEYSEHKLYVEEHGGVVIVRVPVREYDKRNKKQRVANILDFYRGAKAATRKLAETQKFDLVFTYSQPPILGGMLGVYGSKVTAAPYIYGIQDFNPEQVMAVGYAGNAAIHKVMMELDKRSCRNAACVIVPGRDMKETLERRFEGEQVPFCEVINNWADDERIVPLAKDHPKVAAFRRRYGLDDKFVIMYSGNLGLYYDLPNIMKVIEKFKDNGDVVFAFVGEGAVKGDLEEYALSHKMDNVVFIPYQPKDELVYSLNAADVHLVTNAKGIKGVSCPSKLYALLAVDASVLGILEIGSEAWRIIEETHCGKLVEAGHYDAMFVAFGEIANGVELTNEDQPNYCEKKALFSKHSAFNRYRRLFQGYYFDVSSEG